MHVCAHMCVKNTHTPSYIHKHVYTLLTANQVKHVCVPQTVLLYTHLHVCMVYMHACTQTHVSAPSTRGQGVNMSQQEDVKFLIMTQLVLQMEL